MTGIKSVELEIVSDTICPWCFVGKRQLEVAREMLPAGLTVNVRWRPFLLNPDMPAEGVDRRTYLTAKFGSWQRSQELDALVAAAGTAVGITFRHDLMRRTPNTTDSHRLIRLAGVDGRQEEVVESLFVAYFTEGRDIGDVEVLADVARQAGLDAQRARAMLGSDEGRAEVLAEVEAAQRQAVRSVPTFRHAGEILFAGAIRASLMANAIAVAAGYEPTHTDAAA